MKTDVFRNELGAAALCIGLLLALACIAYNYAQAANSAFDCPNGPLAAELTGPAISDVTPAGTARFRNQGSNALMVNLRSVNVAANTNLDVFIGDTKVGTIKVGRGRSGRLRLDSTTAAIDVGTVITIRNGADTILTGTFACIAGGQDTSANANANTNTNSNSNSNANANTNTNTNSNVNTNANSNANANPNRSTNRNTNTNRTRPSPTPSPE